MEFDNQLIVVIIPTMLKGKQMPEATQQETSPEVENNNTAKDYFGYDLEKVQENVEKAVDPEKDGIDPQELVNKTLKEIKVDENGKFIYPDDIDPLLKVAVANAKSFRDTQASYTKTRQELKALEAERNALKEELEKLYHPTADLSEDEKLELEELKITNPEQWYKRMRALEEASAKKIDEKLSEVHSKTQEELIAEERQAKLEEFNKTHGIELTPEQLELEVPPKYTRDLNEGKITWEEYLEKAAKFLTAPRKVETEEAPQTTNLNSGGGGSKPVKSEPDSDILKAYQSGAVLL